eukprot:TRINITY_DN3633_c0_g1_i1.p1 TRINITY_DN3633_c0_g1~~TRINITY_DN3633_c0_g1_i1.p1  ORF type:complete len:103 (-),score=29.10 TRINITY_DN3633_c0_g1_i1:154-462(-)
MAQRPSSSSILSPFLKNGKDRVFFVDASETTSPEQKVSWDCPCQRGMLKRPCGHYYKQFFLCTTPKILNTKAGGVTEEIDDACHPTFEKLIKCIQSHPLDYV